MEILQGRFGPVTLEEIVRTAERLHWKVEKRGTGTAWSFDFTYVGDDLLDEKGHPLFQFVAMQTDGSAAMVLDRVHFTRVAYNPKLNRDFQIPIFYKHLVELDDALAGLKGRGMRG